MEVGWSGLAAHAMSIQFGERTAQVVERRRVVRVARAHLR